MTTIKTINLPAGTKLYYTTGGADVVEVVAADVEAEVVTGCGVFKGSNVSVVVWAAANGGEATAWEPAY